MQDDIVETSDAEEEEEIRAAKQIYWKKDVKHETSDRSDDNSPKKRLKLSHASETNLETHRSLISSAYGTPPPPPQSPQLARSPSSDPLSLFDSPLHPNTELPDMAVPTPSMEGPSLITQRSLSPQSPRPFVPPILNSAESTQTPPSSLLTLFESPHLHRLQVTVSTGGGHDVVPPLLALDVANIPDQPRYPLRQRGANQLKPYTIEKLQYKKALRSNPDAIVKFRSPSRGGRYHQNGTADNLQEQWEPYAADDDGPWEAPQQSLPDKSMRGGPSRIPTSVMSDGDAVPPVQYSEFLQDLPTTDEEEAKDLKALSKEAKKAARERRAREAKEKMYKKKPKSFPLSKRHTSTDEAPSQMGSGHSTHTRHISAVDLERQPDRPLTPIFISAISPDPPFKSKNHLRPRSSAELFDHGDDSGEHPNVSHSITDRVKSPEVGGSDMDDEHTQRPRRGSDHDGHNNLTDDPLDRKRMKALSRMVPAFMLKHLADDGVSSKPARQRQRSVIVVSDSDDASDRSGLQPGKTRTRWTNQLRSNAEIKGDTESSDDAHTSTGSESEGTQYYHGPYLSQERTSVEVIDISDSSEEVQESSDEGVDDETIQAYLDGKIVARKPHRSGQRGEESLIDWMLSKAQTIGGPRKVKVGKRPSNVMRKRKAPSQSNYKMDVITNHGRGMGRERQSKLSFGHQTGNTKRRRSSRRNDKPPLTLVIGGGDNHEHLYDEAFALFDSISHKKARKERTKERRARARANGVYTFSSNDTQLVTGLRAKGMVTIDIEEDDYNVGPAWCYSSAPPGQIVSAIPKFPDGLEGPPAVSQSRMKPNSVLGNWEIESRTKAAKPHRRKIEREGDFGIPLLHSGRSFTPNTFIGKGGLRELCEIISLTATPPVPIPAVSRGIEVGPATSFEDFTKLLREVLRGLFDFATGLPALDSVDEAKEWSDSTHICCRFLSWRLSTWEEKECFRLRAAVQESVSELVLQMRELHLQAYALDSSTFSLCWFMVELSARLGQTIQHQSQNSLSEAVALLIQHLLEFDIGKTMAPICDGSLLDSSTTAGYTAELWVCLFHILDAHYGMTPDAKQLHPFWLVFQRGLESASTTMNPLAASEVIWGGIFSLCALMQFSVHGMTMEKSRLPANWELVVIAVKRVSINPNPKTDDTQPGSQLNKRDIYANLTVRRCVDLSHRWGWSLEQSSNLFNHLVEIFRSRKFANLRHEAPDYPNFMRHNIWDLDLDYRRGDSAFVLFLRLLVKAADYDPTNLARTPSPRAKKLLSLAIPVGSLAFSKSRPTAIRDLSTLSVRLAAIAVGIHVDPTSYASRIAHARTYVDFSDADDTTRKAVIRGIRYLGTLMVTWKVPLDATADWIGALAGELADELRNIPKTIDNPTKRNGLSIILQLLVACVRYIVQTHQACSEYPEPTLLSSLVRIFFITSTEASILDELRRLIEAILKARAAVMPPPERPRLAPIPNAENQESQDDYGDFDLDFDDPALLAALGDMQVLAAGQPDHTRKEEKMRQAVKMTQSHHLAWRSLNTLLKDPQEDKGGVEYFTVVNSWIYCWVGTTLMAVDNGSERASGKIFQLWDPFRATLQCDILDRRQRRVDLTVMMCVLKLDPMSYLEIQDRYLKVLMNCLIAMEVDLDSQFVGLLLSVDGLRHPLLVGAPCERESEEVDFKVAPEEFEVVSLEILKTMVLNLAALCDEGASDRDKYLDLFKGMLSTMRRLSMDERWKSRAGYVQRCRRVVQMASEHLGGRLPGLAFFVDWERTLE